MKAIVCVKQVPDTSGKVAVNPDGTLNRASMATIINPDDKNAVEAALKLKDATGCKVVVITMGPPPAQGMLRELPQEPTVFEQEYDPELHLKADNLPFTVEKSEEEADTYIVEGPRIEKMLGYTNLESEKGFQFFQNFLKDNGILEKLEELGVKDGDTIRMYGLQFDYYK